MSNGSDWTTSGAGAATTGASRMVRVTVASATRRVDLVLPGTVPVAELTPELARSVGLLDAATVYGGYRIVAGDGRVLAPDTGLTLQGVADGGVLTITAGVEDEPPRVYDDIVEAMADVVEQELDPWQPSAGRRTALVGAVLLMAVGALALLVQGATTWASATSSVIAVVLAVGAIVLSRAQSEEEAGVTVGWIATAYGAVGGLLLAGGTPMAGLVSGSGEAGTALMGAGAGALVVALIGLLGLGRGRPLMIPPVVAAAAFTLAGALAGLTDAPTGIVLSVALVVLVLLGSLLPWAALGLTGTRTDQLYSAADITADPHPVQPLRVESDARLAHDILLALTGSVGLLVVLCAPFAVSRGITGTLLAVACCVALMLRTRQYRARAQVLTGLLGGMLGLASVAAAVLWQHETWRPALAVVLAAAGAVTMVATLFPAAGSVRRGRLGDVLESAVLVALLPLLVAAVGILELVQG